jgi:hypothetical protein
MKLRWLFLLLVFASGCHASVSRPKAAPLIVPDFPEPPQQQTKWDSDTNLISSEFVSATKTLFEQGLADPRGCDYREIEIHVGEVWNGGGGNIKTHGWVLPNSSNSNQIVAICWNGLMYPVVSVGAQTNLQIDVESLIASATTNASRMRMTLYGRAIPEKMSVAQDSILPIKACLLSRLGENDLAAKIWNACSVSLENSGGRQPDKDPYLMLAGDWSWSLFDRMICAHMRGDVPLALITARKLTKIQPKIEAEAAQRGFAHPQSYGNGMQKPKEQPYMPFLDQLPQLLADLERRANEPKDKSVIEIGLTNFPNQADRIAVLIEDIDLVKARQFSQPGGVAPQMDPIVQSLIKEGDAAVDPLLDCLENDKRLTCSVGFGRDFFRDRHVLTVASAAMAALEEILHAQFQNAAEVRAYWKQNKGSKLEDRWYATLKDNQAGVERWAEAAKNITQPDNVNGVPGIGFYQKNPTPTNQPVRIHGESLRSKTNPSVSELMTRRALEAASAEPGPLPVQLNTACEIGLCLVSWDIQASSSTAKQLVDNCRNAMATSRDQTQWIVERLGSFIGKLTLARVNAGDTNALEDYTGWLKTMSPDKLETYLPDSLEPLTKYPDEKAVQAVADELFNNPASPWSTLPWKQTAGFNPVESNLVQVPAFRRLVSRELDNREVVGSMQYNAPNWISYEIQNYGGGGRGVAWPETIEPPTQGTKVEIRQCDWIAWSLSNSKRIPFFNPFAALEKRDEAIKNAEADLLKSK